MTREEACLAQQAASSPCHSQSATQYSDVSSPPRLHTSRVSIVDDSQTEPQDSADEASESLEVLKRSLTQLLLKKGRSFIQWRSKFPNCLTRSLIVLPLLPFL